MIMRVLSNLASDPEQIDLPDRGDRHWGHAMHIARFKSFNTIIRFLAGFLRDEEPSDGIAILAAGQDDHLTSEPDAASPSQSRRDSVASGPHPPGRYSHGNLPLARQQTRAKRRARLAARERERDHSPQQQRASPTTTKTKTTCDLPKRYDSPTTW